MLLINCAINLILTYLANCVISEVDRVTAFRITDTKLYVQVATLSTNDNVELLQQFKPGSKRTINWNKYQSKVTIQKQNQYLDYLIDHSFLGINRLFVLSFEDNALRTAHIGYFCLKLERRNYHAMTDGRNFFDQPVKNNIKTYDKIQKIETGQGDDYATGCPLDYLTR